MSIHLEAARAVAVVQRARSLFGTADPVHAGDAPLQSAASSAARAGDQASELAGRSVESHAAIADAQHRLLSAAGRTDSALQAQLRQAALSTATGARRLDRVVAQTNTIAEAAAATARTPAAELMVLTALRAQVAEAQNITATTTRQAAESAGHIRSLSYGSGDRPEAPPEIPEDPSGEDIPRGKDRRYWLDVTKIVFVPDGELAPADTVQVGPNLWYPAPDRPGFAVPAPPPARYPLDLGDVRIIDPDSQALLPPGYREIAPGIGVPYPDARVPAPWPTPQQPVDVRDVIEVGPGQLAPSGYREYLPGWWVPERGR